MKRIIIGGFIALSSAIIDAAIIIAAGVYSSSLTSWSGSKFWYAIFGAPRYGNEANLSLNLGPLFIAASLLFILGIVIMLIELLRKGNA